MYNCYVDKGVILKPNVIGKGDKATVVYKGLLANSGANNVYMHVGYGDNWENCQDICMTRSKEGFTAEIPITCRENLNVAFKDCANNWDNNNCQNYTFEVLNS